MYRSRFATCRADTCAILRRHELSGELTADVPETGLSGFARSCRGVLRLSVPFEVANVALFPLDPLSIDGSHDCDPRIRAVFRVSYRRHGASACQQHCAYHSHRTVLHCCSEGSPVPRMHDDLRHVSDQHRQRVAVGLRLAIRTTVRQPRVSLRGALRWRHSALWTPVYDAPCDANVATRGRTGP